MRRLCLGSLWAVSASWRAILLCWVLMLSVACEPGPTPTPVAVPTMPRPPEAKPVPTSVPMTLVPPPTPTIWPTPAITPTPVPMVLDKWQVYESQDKSFSFRFPPDWGGRELAQAITNTLQPLTVDMVWLRGPGGASGPEFVLMHHWPPLDVAQPLVNATAWSSVAGLAKLFLYPNCATTFDSPTLLTLAGQQTWGVKFVVQCDRLYAGYLAGIVHNGVSYGLLADVPAEDWDAWRPTIETMFASFALNP